MKEHLTVILGAGFSANAGMPTANSIATRFNRDLRKKLISASSSEWFWIDDKSEVFIHNGRLNYDYLAYSYVFNELVKKYVIDNNKEFMYYEDFYQYIIDNFKKNEWVEELFEIAKNSLISDHQYLLEDKNKEFYKSYLFAFEHKQFSKVSNILNYLIGDILNIIPKENAELLEIYNGFIEYIKSFKKVDIFTLNHDLLLERLLDINGINYSKGFNIEQSPIIYNDNPIPFFNNVFKENIRIHKLHGSLDFYQFRHYEKGGLFLRPTEKVDYFMTSNYYVKHNSQLINPETKEILQDYNYDIVPKFITGTRKTETIKNDILYRELFKNFENIINNTKDLFVSGYSFSDEHLNEKLKGKEFNYINHNRSKDFPFDGNGKNIRSLNEL